MQGVNVGDIALSVCGRDKGEFFLVVSVEDGIAKITDGKTRKVQALKNKNTKHLKSVKIAVLKDIAIQIRNGQPVGNERLHKAIKSELQKKEED